MYIIGLLFYIEIQSLFTKVLFSIYSSSTENTVINILMDYITSLLVSPSSLDQFKYTDFNVPLINNWCLIQFFFDFSRVKRGLYWFYNYVIFLLFIWFYTFSSQLVLESIMQSSQSNGKLIIPVIPIAMTTLLIFHSIQFKNFLNISNIIFFLYSFNNLL